MLISTLCQLALSSSTHFITSRYQGHLSNHVIKAFFIKSLDHSHASNHFITCIKPHSQHALTTQFINAMYQRSLYELVTEPMYQIDVSKHVINSLYQITRSLPCIKSCLQSHLSKSVMEVMHQNPLYMHSLKALDKRPS